MATELNVTPKVTDRRCLQALKYLNLYQDSIPVQNYRKLVIALSDPDSLLLMGRTFSLSNWVNLLGGSSSQVEALLFYKYCREQVQGKHQNQVEGDVESKESDNVSEKNKSNERSWTFVYENSKTGKCINGNLKELINAINEGAEVRVILNHKDHHQIKSWTAEVVQVKNGIVYAQQNTEISLCGFEPNSSTFFQDNAYHYYVVVSSKGQQDMTRYNVTDGKSRGHTNGKVGIKWFVRA